MKLEFTYSPGDLQEALSVKWPDARRGMEIVGIALTVILIGILIFEICIGTNIRDWKMGFWLRSGGKWSFDTMIEDYSRAFFAALCLGLWICFYRWSKSRRGLATWKASLAVRLPQNYIIDDTGIKVSSKLTNMVIHWSTMHSWVETTNLFVICPNSKKGLLAIPKHAATSDQLEELRVIFRERVIGPAKGFPVALARGADIEPEQNIPKSPQ